MPLQEAVRRIGQKAVYAVMNNPRDRKQKALIPVIIKDVVPSWGKTLFEVEPVGGKGRIRVEKLLPMSALNS